MDKLLTQLMNMFMRRFMGTAINKGIDHFAGGGKPKDQQTPEERSRVENSRALAKRAKQVQKVMRRLR